MLTPMHHHLAQIERVGQPETGGLVCRWDGEWIEDPTDDLLNLAASTLAGRQYPGWLNHELA